MSRCVILALLLAVTGTAGALSAVAGEIYRLGILQPSQPAAMWRSAPQMRSFLEGLQQLGYVEGQNLVIDFRSAESEIERLPGLAAELVALLANLLERHVA